MTLEVQRRRLAVTIAINLTCVVIATAAVVGALSFHAAWLIWVFAASLCAGFATQAWLIAGVLRNKAR